MIKEGGKVEPMYKYHINIDVNDVAPKPDKDLLN